jgi:hypothetical protein
MEIPNKLDVNCGARMRGYFYPQTSGTYQFAISGDNAAILLFSPTGISGSATQIASANNTGYEQWGQLSAPIVLTAGQVCYIEALGVQSAVGSNMSVGYIPPGAVSCTLMPATNVVPYDPCLNYVTGTAAAVAALAHPRLMGMSPAAIARLKAAIAVNGSMQNADFHTVKTHFDENFLNDTTPITPIQGGNLYDAAGDLLNQVYFCSCYYMLTTDGTAAQQSALNSMYLQLQAAANWGTSGTSGQTGWNTYDYLTVAVTSNAFSIAYDWCYSGWTPAQRTFLLNAIVSHSLNYAIQAYAIPQPSWAFWVNCNYNWGIVCDGGNILAALAVLGDETGTPLAPTVLDDYIPTLHNSPAVAAMGPDGGWQEAVDYWDFSQQYFTAALSSLETTQGTCYNIDTQPGVASQGAFPLYYIDNLVPGLCFGWGDNYSDGEVSSPWQRYLGIKYNQPVYSWSQQQRSGYIEPMDVIWWDPRCLTATPQSLNAPTSAAYTDGLIFLRDSWGDRNAQYMGMKAGTVNWSHAHEELGSFVYDALGVRWISSLGRDSYGLTNYFDFKPWDSPDRFQYYRMRAEGNNTLVFNPSWDGGQCSTGTTSLVAFVSNPTTQEAIIDMSSIYATTDGNPKNKVSSSTGITQVQRGMRFLNGVAQLQDVAVSSTAVNMTWFMHTSISNIVLSSGSTVATLTSGSANLQMTIQSPAGAVFTTGSAVPLSTSPDSAAFQTNPPSNGEAWNPGITVLKINVPNSTNTQLTVSMCPYFTGNLIPPIPLKVIPFGSWPTAAALTLSFSQWESNYFNPTQMANFAVSAASATPQNDGRANLLKYLCDINPSGTMTATDLAALPTVGTTSISGSSYLTLSYRQNPLVAGIVVNAQTSTDLQKWQTVIPSSIQQVSTDPVTGDPIIQVQVQVTPGTPAEFIRLNVTQL